MNTAASSTTIINQFGSLTKSVDVKSIQLQALNENFIQAVTKLAKSPLCKADFSTLCVKYTTYYNQIQTGSITPVNFKKAVEPKKEVEPKKKVKSVKGQSFFQLCCCRPDCRETRSGGPTFNFAKMTVQTVSDSNFDSNFDSDSDEEFVAQGPKFTLDAKSTTNDSPFTFNKSEDKKTEIATTPAAGPAFNFASTGKKPSHTPFKFTAKVEEKKENEKKMKRG